MKSFFNVNPALVGFETKGFALGQDESYPMGDGGKNKFRHGNSSWLGGNDDAVRPDTAMCRPRAKWADWEIRLKVGE